MLFHVTYVSALVLFVFSFQDLFVYWCSDIITLTCFLCIPTAVRDFAASRGKK